MLYNLPGFTALLRRAGVRVSPGETEDFCKAVLLTGMAKDTLESVALATLAKGDRENRITKKLFDLYFSPPARSFAGLEKCDPVAVLSDPPRLEAGEFLARLEALRASVRNELYRLKRGESGRAGGKGRAGAGRGRAPFTASRPERLLEALRAGDRVTMQALARDAVQGVLKDTGSCPEGFEEILRQVKVSLDWAASVDLLDKESHDCRSMIGLGNIKDFERIIVDELDRELWRSRPGAVQEVAGRASLQEIDFGRLNLEQIEDMKRMVTRMARSLSTRLSYRRARSRKGEVDLRRTARFAAQTGGVPLKLFRRARIPHRPELAVLCDLSGSVSLFTGFLLQLIYAVQERFSRVRTFAFVDDVEEITALLKGREAGEAILRVLREARIARTPFSDYGAVWKKFYRKYSDCINPKTTVLILGDARNNWKPTGVEYLERIQVRASRIVWLNPAPMDRWERDDCIISQYAPYCHRLFECRNLKQLAAVARYIGKM